MVEMDKRIFASMIVKYWYLVEFLGQSDFPVQSQEGRELCVKTAQGEAHTKQITVYHMLSNQADTLAGDQKSISIGTYTALQNDAHVYSAYGVLSDEIHVCLGKMERYLFAERLCLNRCLYFFDCNSFVMNPQQVKCSKLIL